MEQLTNAEKRERYLFACITLFQTASEIIEAEGFDFSDEMPDEEPRQIIEDLLEIIERISVHQQHLVLTKLDFLLP